MFDLKRFRKDKKLTQNGIAELFSCKQNFISDIERGKKSLPIDKFELLQSEYGDISDYITDNNKPEEPKNDTLEIKKSQITIHSDVWDVIKEQSQTMRKQADSLEVKDEQINRIIKLLEDEISERKKMDVQRGDSAICAGAK